MWNCLTLAAAGSQTMIVIDLLIILAAAALVAIVMQRARLAVIPAYLLTGALIGPGALGAVTSPDSLESISRLAIILLMFGIGMELNLSSLRRGLSSMVGIGVVSCVFSILIAWPLMVMYGLTSPGAIAIGMALSTSSTAVVLRVLAERREMQRPHGRLCFAISAVQDFLVLAMLASLPLLAKWAGLGSGALGESDGSAPGGWAGFAIDAALKIGGMAALIVAGQVLVPRLMHEAAQGRSAEVMLVLSTAFAIGAAVATQALGFSAELGAFIAGYVLSATPFRHQLSGQIGPLRDLFLAVFFTTVGMNLNPVTLAQYWWLVLASVAVLIVFKAAAVGGSAWVFGVSAPVAVVVGLSLAGGSEISLVLLGAAHSYGLIGDVTLANAIAIVVLSLIVTPLVMTASHRLAERVRGLPPAPWITAKMRVAIETPAEVEEQEAKEAEEAARQRGGRVVLAGYGVVGRAVAEKLKDMGLEYTIVELNPTTVRTQGELGIPIVYGDISNREVLESAGVRTADVVVLAIPDDEAVLRACEVVRSLAPNAFIAARTSFLSKGMAATRLGADHVTVEEMATAEAMAREVAKRLSEKRDEKKRADAAG